MNIIANSVTLRRTVFFSITSHMHHNLFDCFISVTHTSSMCSLRGFGYGDEGTGDQPTELSFS